MDQTELPVVPLERWLSAKELAARFRLKEDSTYRWYDAGSIPPLFVKFLGQRGGRRLFHPALVKHLEEVFAAAHRKHRVGRPA